MKTQRNYKHGLLDGEYVKYYDSGFIHHKSFYSKGKKEGEYVKYYDNGKMHYKSFTQRVNEW